MSVYTPQNLWSIQLEIVEGCNYSCWFCGIHGIRDPKNWHVYNRMNPELVTAAFKELNVWLPKIRVEINNHGEPSLHPELPGIMQRIRSEMPTAQIQLQTNGSSIEGYENFEARVTEWFASGCNMLCLNAYKRWWGTPLLPSRYRWFLTAAKAYGRDHNTEVIDLYHDNPDHYSMYHYHNPKTKIILVLDDLGDMNQQDRGDVNRPVSKDICNEAGNTPQKPLEKLLGRPALEAPLAKRCTRPFREMILSWDGHVPICCYDWSSQLVMGKFPESSLQELWYSSIWNDVREILYRKNRRMTPCNVCDYGGGYRQGLLKPPNLTHLDSVIQARIAAHMKRFTRYTHANAPVVIGLDTLRKSKKASS